MSDSVFDKSLDTAKQLSGAPKPVRPPKPMIASPGNVAAAVDPSGKGAIKQVEAVEDAFDFPVALRIGIIGCGQAGGRIAQAFWELGYRRVGALNTTQNDFNGLDPEMPKLTFEVGGASKDMQIAISHLKTRVADVKDLLVRTFGSGPLDCVLVCAGLGGGTGSGMAPHLVDIIKQYLVANGNPTTRVGVIVSLPQPYEGQRTCSNALATFANLYRAKVSPMLVIDNNKVKNVYNTTIDKLYPTANNMVAQLFNLFNFYAGSRDGIVTFDKSELLQLLDSGVVTMGAADIPHNTVKSPADIRSAVREQLTGNVLAAVDLSKGKKGICVFVLGKTILETFADDYFSAGFTQLDEYLGTGFSERPPTILHRGIYSGEDDAGIQCYTMVGDLEPPKTALQELSRVAQVSRTNPGGVESFLGIG